MRAKLAALGAIILGVLTALARAKRQGRKEAIQDMKEADHEQADTVRRAVADVDRVRDKSGLKYRD